jgi:hypothetical protein
MRDDKENIIVDLTLKFAVSIIEYCEDLESKRKYVIARQLLNLELPLVLMLTKHKMQRVKQTLSINLT